jgi:transitional endoplasmic reticulum ATPase
MEEQELKLRVAEAVQDDVNKGIVRIDSSLMKQIGVSPGDVVELEAKRKTVAIADRSYPGDLGLTIIRMDGIARRNTKASIGEVVGIRKIEVKEAKKVTIAPARKGVIIKASPHIFKQGLLGRPVVKGDIVSLGGSQRRRSAMSGNPFFEDMFNVLDENLMGFGFSDLKFVVANTNPAKMPVIISDETEVEFNPESVEVKEETTIEVNYEDIGGLRGEIKKIREMVELPLKHPEVFERLGIEPPKGVLLHGPPGTGKTLLAKAVASETSSNFLLINGPEIMSKYYGQSEENLRKKFEDAEKNAPSIIFIDEIDAIASKREETRGEVERRVVAQLLSLMDGLQSRGKVIVLAATNRPNALDPALRRPGRFDREIEIGVPSQAGRLDVLKIHTRNMPIRGNIYDDVVAEELKSDINKKLKEFNKTRIELEGGVGNINLGRSSSESQESKKEYDEISNDEGVVKPTSEKLGRSGKGAELKELNQNILELKKIEEMFKTKKKMNSIAKGLKEYHGLVRKFGDTENPRKKFLEKSSKSTLVPILDTFELCGIINEEFWSRIEREGAKRDLRQVSDITYGFVGADLAALAKEAAMVVLRRVLPDLKLDEEEPIPSEVLEKMYITIGDFREALRIVRPSAMREVLVEVPNVDWMDVGGLESVRQELMEAVEWPLKHPESFQRLGIRPPRGILIYGAPGTGKTLLAKAVAHESEANFILVNGPSLLSKWVGESEKAVREIFRKARQTAPTIIFFDEIDSLAPKRGSGSDNNVSERVVNQILTEMDGLQELQDVVVIAATNRPDMVDTALLRPGRFDRIILAAVPDKNARKKIFEVHLKGMPLADGVSVDSLAEESEGYVGADIEAVCREAAILALREDMQAKIVNKEHFDEALKKVKPSVTEDIEEMYEEMENFFKQARAKEMQENRPRYLG